MAISIVKIAIVGDPPSKLYTENVLPIHREKRHKAILQLLYPVYTLINSFTSPIITLHRHANNSIFPSGWCTSAPTNIKAKPFTPFRTVSLCFYCKNTIYHTIKASQLGSFCLLWNGCFSPEWTF